MSSLAKTLINFTRKTGDKVVSALERAEINKIRKEEIAKAARAYQEVAQMAPGDFEALGLRLRKGNLLASSYFKNCETEYEGFRKIWNQIYPDNKLSMYF